jgi:hypothetical protein
MLSKALRTYSYCLQGVKGASSFPQQPPRSSEQNPITQDVLIGLLKSFRASYRLHIGPATMATHQTNINQIFTPPPAVPGKQMRRTTNGRIICLDTI